MAGQRLHQGRQGVAVATRAARTLGVAAACGACAAETPLPAGAVRLDAIVTAQNLVGAWEWSHFEIEDGTSRRERERWAFAPTTERRRLVGRYTRDVLVRALDGVPFEGKTGTLDAVVCLSGYVRTKDGRELIASLTINHAVTSSNLQRDVADRFMATLAQVGSE